LTWLAAEALGDDVWLLFALTSKGEWLDWLGWALALGVELPKKLRLKGKNEFFGVEEDIWGEKKKQMTKSTIWLSWNCEISRECFYFQVHAKLLGNIPFKIWK